MKKLVLMLLPLVTSAAFAQYQYPGTKRVDSADTYFGVTYHDPYRWLEFLKDPQVVTWFKAQADYSNSILNKINGRDALIAEWNALDKLQPETRTGMVYENGRLFYRKTAPGEPVGKLYYREGMTDPEVLLFDPLNYVAGKTLTMENFVPSFDGKQVAIFYSQKGAEVSTMRIMNIDSRQFSPEAIYPTHSAGVFTLDNKAIIYLSLKTADNTDPKARLNNKTKFHIIGQDTAKDFDFFSSATYPELNIEPKAYPLIQTDEHNKGYIFGQQSSVRRDLMIYYAAMPKSYTDHMAWKTLCQPADKISRTIEVIDGVAYAICHDGAPNFKLVATPLTNPDWKNAKVIASEKSDQTLEKFTHSKHYLLLNYSNGITDFLYKYDLRTGATTKLNLPTNGNFTVIRMNCVDVSKDVFTFDLSSNIRPDVEYELDAATDNFSPGLFNRSPAYPDAYNHLIEKNVEVKGHDGVMVPLTIIYKEGTKMDGNNVCLMDSYGAYGVSMSPYFVLEEISLTTKGVILALPHVRGGSEKGLAWYMAGYKTTKPNTWKDFNSCAEYLIANGYTRPSRLAGTGTSAGGILISRAITERPDLYAAAICNVGAANVMRLEFSANGPINTPEFGTVKDSVECRALYVMDGMQHVASGTKYPALIGVGGWNDPRVAPWEPAKFVAAVQNASTSGKPVLMKINYDNGHFTEDKSVTWANFADQFAFVLWQCGDPDFQLKAQSK